MNFQLQKIFKNFFFFCVCILLLGWGTQWFLNGLIDFSEWKMSQNKALFLGSVSDSAAGARGNYVSKIKAPYRDWEIEDLKIDAEAAISVETDLLAQKKVLFKKNETKILPIASLLKLMTTLVVLENYNLQHQTIITEADILQKGDQGDLKAGQSLSVKNLLYITLIESSNDAAFALSSIMGQDKFIALMNAEAKNIGLLNTHFTDSSGLDFGSYSTAEDLVALTEHLLNKYPLVWEIIGLKEYDLYLDNGEFHHKLMNTNKLLGEIPEVIGGKTGFTNYAKECFLVVEKSPDSKNYLMHVILGSADKLEEMKKIINWLNVAYKW